MRRPFRRLMGALFNPNGTLFAEAQEAFDDAVDLYDSGQYNDAGERFAHLAEMAQNFNRPRRTVQLRMRACDAWLKAKQPANAVRHARTAIGMVAGAGRLKVAVNIARQVIEDLRADGYASEANAFTKEINDRLAVHGVSLAQSPAVEQSPQPAPQRGTLPSVCPQCSGRLPRSFGEDEIECDYCGSVIRAE
jgi:hypothetical protein